MTVRKAKPADVPKISACAKAAYAMYVERIGREPAPMIADFGDQVAKGMVYVIDNNHDVDGYVIFYPRGDHMHLENVAVLPQQKGKGLGRQLIAFVEHEARQQGCQAVELYTNLKMSENLTMYPRLGYLEYDRRIEDGFERVYFRKDLGQGPDG